MGTPRLVYRWRPKKTGARKKYRVKTHRKRLLAVGYDEKYLNTLTEGRLRSELMKIARRRFIRKISPPPPSMIEEIASSPRGEAAGSRRGKEEAKKGVPAKRKRAKKSVPGKSASKKGKRSGK